MTGGTEPGARGRIGVIQPAPGLMLEHEWADVLPDGVAAPVTRLALAGGTRTDYDRMAEEAPQAARVLRNAQAGVVAYACGVGSMVGGPEGEADLMAALQTAGGVPAIGIGQAVVAALRRLGSRRVVVLTPYTNEVNAIVTGYLEAAGFVPEGLVRLPAPDVASAARLSTDEVLATLDMARDRHPDADAVWSTCTNVPTRAAIAAAGRDGIPLISSNQALLWRCLGALRVRAPDPYGGQLDA